MDVLRAQDDSESDPVSGLQYMSCRKINETGDTIFYSCLNKSSSTDTIERSAAAGSLAQSNEFIPAV